jgi:hypothetical protein
MTKANQYNLTFVVSPPDQNFPRMPIINLINGINALNHEIASFLEPNGVELVDSIKDEINSFNYNNSFSGYYVFGYHDAESVEIRNFPPNAPIAVFNTGGVDVIVPLSDFLQILDEWKAFVASVPTPHWLQNR